MTTKMEKDVKDIQGTPPAHRRILNFLNSATRPKDLMHPPRPIRGRRGQGQEEAPTQYDQKPEPIFDADLSKAIFDRRESFAPFGFRHIQELFEIKEVNWRDIIEKWLHYFGHRFYGHWETPAYETQRPDGSAFSVAHAAMLHTDHVLFLPQFETTETLLWDLTDENNPHFEFPTVQTTEFLFCSGHSFLADGKLLVVGGGGNAAANAISSAWKFDPVTRAWNDKRADGSKIIMSERRWYPTAVTLGDNRVSVTCGNTIGNMEIYDPVSEGFFPVAMPVVKPFPARYPGFHLLPSGVIFFSRTGWHGGLTPGRNAAYFTLDTGLNSGQWTEMTSEMTFADRREGMSVMLLHPFVRIMVIGGGSHGGALNSLETIDVSALSPASPWDPQVELPEERIHVNAVFLPDGSVFVCGGMSIPNSPCRLYNPFTDTWHEMAALPSVKGYHSVALLLPSGKVMVAGGSNTTIEIFHPPYLYRGARPTIASAPSLVHHGQTFSIETPDAEVIVKTVLVRPMAVTHQTDTEQRVIEMHFLHDHTQPDRLVLTAPLGGYPRSLAPQGYYMLFILNRDGVPSVANWIYLH